ncbi:MAG: HlyD family efflux transporter periplasmic adaptor subunit [Bacteroidales bacterium]|nr:HlyD family efflux transporter periplasmic adaptor subunit [Bacteroidales bacterium]
MKKLIFISALALLVGCSRNSKISDAYGIFEATEITISSEANGKILEFVVDEGQQLDSGTVIGQIDTVDLHLKVEQLQAQRDAMATKTENIEAQIQIQNQQKENILIEKARVEKMLKDGAATSKQLDDINASLRIIDKQINSINTQNNSLSDELRSVDKQIAQIKESIRKCRIVNPVKGTILAKYVEPKEFATIGKSLYKIADMNEMFLKIYISGEQLPHIKTGQKAEILIDNDKKTNTKLEGEISWISSNAEFTPKIIQTKEERVNLVYAAKVKVKNNGFIKIGMPGEVNFK